eukprot:6179324-Amphidinium_carterae.2
MMFQICRKRTRTLNASVAQVLPYPAQLRTAMDTTRRWGTKHIPTDHVYHMVIVSLFALRTDQKQQERSSGLTALQTHQQPTLEAGTTPIASASLDSI